jgi:hypothetical protein
VGLRGVGDQLIRQQQELVAPHEDWALDRSDAAHQGGV